MFLLGLTTTLIPDFVCLHLSWWLLVPGVVLLSKFINNQP